MHHRRKTQTQWVEPCLPGLGQPELPLGGGSAADYGRTKAAPKLSGAGLVSKPAQPVASPASRADAGAGQPISNPVEEIAEISSLVEFYNLAPSGTTLNEWEGRRRV